MAERSPDGHQVVEDRAPVPQELLAPPKPVDKPEVKTNKDVHAFYYPWYGSPEFDGDWLHWNHEFLPHWDPATDRKYPKGRHHPPDDVGANFFPQLGPYSSKDPAVIDLHMKQMSEAGIGAWKIKMQFLFLYSNF
jgi:hypothetical protein